MTAIENLLTALRELHADGCLADCYGMTPEEPLGELIERWAEKNYPDASAETSRAVLLMLCGLHDTSMLRSFYDVQPNEPLGEALESWASLGYPGVSSAGTQALLLGLIVTRCQPRNGVTTLSRWGVCLLPSRRHLVPWSARCLVSWRTRWGLRRSPSLGAGPRADEDIIGADIKLRCCAHRSYSLRVGVNRP